LESEDQIDDVQVVFNNSAMNLVTQSISNSRIHASNKYLQTFAGLKRNTFCNGSDMYLTQQKYAMVKHVGLNFICCLLHFYYFYFTSKCVHVSIPWWKDYLEAYQALCKLWAREEFITKSLKPQESRGSGESGHTYGLDGYIDMCKHMIRKIITKMHS
jgi:hypothetical protein